MRKLLTIMALALALSGAFAMAAQAFVIDFELQPIQTGTVSYGGGATNLVGFDLLIDKITGIGTNLNAGNTAALTNTTNTGLLNFTGPGFTTSLPSHWLFTSNLGTSSLVISGPFSNGGTTITTPVPSITGNWTNAEVHQIGNTNSYAVTGVFTDLKSDPLLAYFGESGTGPETATFAFGITLPAGISPGAPFTSLTVSSGDITETPATVPVPPSAILLGSGLLALVGLRKLSKS
jgi:hypothetical protein